MVNNYSAINAQRYLVKSFCVEEELMSRLARKKPLDVDTPERVYSWFLISHSVCYYSWGVSVYFVLFFGAEIGILLCCLALYFGVLTRDFAEVASDTIFNSVGYSKYEVLPTNLCALCGEELKATLDIMQGKSTEESEQARVVELQCGHEFHENCIRGWAIVGKKDTCPFCFEKISLQSIIPVSMLLIQFV